MKTSASLFSFAILACALAASPTDVPVTAVGSGDTTLVAQWLVLGPFPNTVLQNLNGQRAIDSDPLALLGGEAAARVTPQTTLSGETNGTVWTATAKPYTFDSTRDLRTLFPSAGSNAIAYAFADIESDAPRHMVCRFRRGFPGGSKVWLNGQPVHPAAASREMVTERVEFPVTLQTGRNRLTVKIEHRWWGWNVGLLLLDKERAAASERTLRFVHDDTLQTRLKHSTLRFVAPGRFPAVEFGNPELASLLLDTETLAVRWFDADLNEVIEAAKPGFYCAYVTAQAPQTSQPLAWRRVVPLMVFDDPGKWTSPWDFKNQTLTQWQEGGSFSQAAWEATRPLLTGILQEGWKRMASSDTPVLWMGEMALDHAPVDAWREAPYAHLQDYMAKLRHKVLDRPAPRSLAPPTPESTATALREGTEVEAGFKPGTVENIRAILTEWSEKSGHGFVAVVARYGVVVLHEAFSGAKDAQHVAPFDRLVDGKMTTAARLETASATKFFLGAILGRFMDQGLLDLDAPVRNFFPDFPAEGPLAPLTVRRLMNHTCGLERHRNWQQLEGMVNPFLDVSALWILEADPSEVPYYNYNNFSMDLGGKVIEDITGRSVFRVMRDGLFEPLGMDNPTICALGHGLACTAMDLARMAEMFRQGGTYDGKRYMRPDTLEKLLPIPVGRHAPQLSPTSATEEYGVGIQWLRDPVPAPQHRQDGPHYILGANVYAHSASNGTLVRIASEHELVVAMLRYTEGPSYEEHKTKFLQAIADGLAEE